MCGIIGILDSATKVESTAKRKFFCEALLSDMLRGFDSTGMMFIPGLKKDTPEDVLLYKRALPAYDFLETRQFKDKIYKTDDYAYLIGHNRAASRGKVSHSNSHPFQIGNITLVHNGTLHSVVHLPDQHLFDVDSEIITNALNKNPVEDVIKELDGSFVLVWHDMKTGAINVIRNEERPFSIGYSDNKKTVYMASEEMMLKWIAARNGIKLKRVFTPKPGELYSFYAADVQDPETQRLKLFQKAVRPYNGYYGNSAYNNKHNNKNNDLDYTFELKDYDYKIGDYLFIEILDYDIYPSYRGGKRVFNGDTIGTVVGFDIFKEEYKNTLVYKVPAVSFQKYKKIQERKILKAKIVSSYIATGNKKVVNLSIDDNFSDEECKEVLELLQIQEKEKALKKDKVKNGTVVIANPLHKHYDLYSAFKKGARIQFFNGDNLSWCSTENPHWVEETIYRLHPEDEKHDGKLDKRSSLVDFIAGPNNEWVSLKEFTELTKNGCAYCTCDLLPENAEKIQWTQDNTPICDECFNRVEFNL